MWQATGTMRATVCGQKEQSTPLWKSLARWVLWGAAMSGVVRFSLCDACVKRPQRGQR